MLLKPHERKANWEFVNDSVWTIIFQIVFTNNHFSIMYCPPWIPVQSAVLLGSKLGHTVDVATKLPTLRSKLRLSTNCMMDLVSSCKYPPLGSETAFDLQALQHPHRAYSEMETCTQEENKGQPIPAFKILKSERLLQFGGTSAFLFW